MTLRVTTPPAAPLISVADLKVQCRIDGASEDSLLAILALTATQAVETEVQRRYVAQTLEWVVDGWSCVGSLPVAGENMAVSAIAYVDAAGASRTLAADQYVVSPCGWTLAIRRAFGAVWPIIGYDAVEAVKVTFTVGVADPATAAPVARQAALLIGAHFYANREAVLVALGTASALPLPLGFSDLLIPERWG